MVQRRLGAGAFGVVYEAYDRQEQALVALKVLRLAEADSLYRFKKGFRSLADLRHPNLVSFYELMNHEGTWFFSMELIPGRELTETLERESGPVDFERVRSIVLQLSRGLQKVHEHGMLHRDIKPSNVLVTPEDEVKLLDFGLVAELGPRRMASGEAMMVGTPAYMSPEQANGESGEPHGDWYSVGVMLFQCLTGSLPFDGSLLEVLTRKQEGLEPGRLRQLVPDVPEDLEKLCLGLLEAEPDDRLIGPEVLQILERDDSRVDLSRLGTANFVGRREQLRQLDEALEASRRGTVLVHIKGLSGMGKSALLDHFSTQVEAIDEQAVVLRGRCYVQEAVPYKALDSLVDALSRFLLSLPRHDAEVLLPTRIAALARLFPVLRRVPAVDQAPSTRDAEPADPQILRRRAFGALRELLARLAVRRTLVLIIDDLQWGDLDSFVLIDEMLKAADPLPVLFIGSYRSENEASSPFLRAFAEQRQALEWRDVDVREIELGELSRREARALVRRLSAGSDGPQIDGIVADAAGSPLFLSELARAAAVPIAPVREETTGAASTPAETARDATAESPPEDPEPRRVAGPDTAALHVRDLITARVSSLGEPARQLLEVLAVAGRPLELPILRRAAQLESGGISALAELRTGRFVRISNVEGREEIEPYHDRVREVVTENLETDRLRDLHRRLALTLEATGSADPETLAVHFQATEEDERAHRYAVSAARRAEETLAFQRAARLYRLALDLLPPESEERYELQVRLGEALGNAGRSRDAAETLLDAVGTAGGADPLEVQRGAAEKLLISGHIDRGMAVLRHVLRTVDMELEPRAWRSLLHLWWLRLRLRLRGFEFSERAEHEIDAEKLRRIDVCWSVEIGLCLVDVLHASEFHARHLLLALEAGESQRIARGLAMEVFFGAMEGASDRSVLERARDLAGRVEGRYASSLTEMAAGMLACSKGEWAEAQRRLARAEMYLRENRRGVAWELDTVRQFRSVAQVYLGRWPDLFSELPDLLELAREQEDLYLETHLRHWVENLRHLASDDIAAATESSQGLEQWSQSGFHYQHFSQLVAQARVALYRGRPRFAFELVGKRWAELTGSMIQRIELVLIQSHDLRGRTAVACAALSEPSESRRYLRLAESDARRLERVGSTWALGLAAALRAGIAGVGGEKEQAGEELAVAETAFEAADMHVHAAFAHRCRGLLSGARHEVEAADRTLADLGVVRPDRLQRAFLPGRWPESGD